MFKILTGPYLNHLTRVATAPAMDPAALTGFAVTNLYDNRASIPCIFSTGQEDSTVTIDLNLIRGGGDFETGAELTEWTVLDTGTPTIEANPYTGSGNLRLTPVIDQALIVQDSTVRAGEVMTFTAAAAANSTMATSSVLVRNRQTGRFLTSTGGWVASTGGYLTGSTIVSNAATSYATATVNFTVEDLDTCKSDTVSLRVYLLTIGSGGGTYGDFDSIGLWPHTSFASVHGHNFSPFITPTLQYSVTSTSWSDVSTMTVRRDSFYLALGSTSVVTSRYVRLLLGGYPDVGSLPYMGELVLGQYYSLLQNPNYGGSITWTEKQVRLQSSIGDQFVHLHGGRPVRSMLMSFNLSSTQEYEQVWRQIFRGSRGGSNLCVVAPEEEDGEQVVMGRIREAITVEKHTTRARTAELEVVESPLPNVSDLVYVYDAPITEVSTGA